MINLRSSLNWVEFFGNVPGKEKDSDEKRDSENSDCVFLAGDFSGMFPGKKKILFGPNLVLRKLQEFPGNVSGEEKTLEKKSSLKINIQERERMFSFSQEHFHKFLVPKRFSTQNLISAVAAVPKPIALIRITRQIFEY